MSSAPTCCFRRSGNTFRPPAEHFRSLRSFRAVRLYASRGSETSRSTRHSLVCLVDDTAAVAPGRPDQKAEVAINDAVTELLSKLPPALAFTSTGAAIGHHGV